MERIQSAFEKARTQGRSAFISYICAGDPDFETSVEICRELVAAGVDILEIGVPFTDPLADGLTNQLAAQRALESGSSHERVFDLVKKYEVWRYSRCSIHLLQSSFFSGYSELCA